MEGGADGTSRGARGEAPGAAPLPALVPEGPVVGGTPLRLGYLIAGSGAGGRLVLEEAEGVRHEIPWRRGTPHGATTTLPELGLLRWLAGQGLLSPDAEANAAAAVPAHGGDPAAALFALGLLQPSEAFAHLGAHRKAVLVRALSTARGRFRWEPDVAPPPGAFALGDRWALLCDAGRALEPSEVAQRLGGRIDCPVMRAGDGLVPLEGLGLTTRELRAVAGFDGTRSLAMLAAAAPGEAAILYRTGLFLAEMGLASFAPVQLQRPADAPAPGASAAPAPTPPGDPPPRIPPDPVPPHRAAAAVEVPSPRTPPEPAPPHRAPRPAPPPRPIPREAAGGSRAPVDVAGLRATLAELEGKDHFAVLGVPRSAPAALIKQAFFGRARSYHPDLAATGDPEIRQLRQAITARLNEAWSCLSDERRRAAYLADLEAGAASTRGVDVAHVLVAEQLFLQATVMVKARRFAEAIAELDRAIALYGEEGEFHAWRGYARFSAAVDKRAVRDEAMAEIERAVALNPRCGPAFLFAGRIATVLGDADGAIKYYRRCLAVDEQNLEAQRELRLLESRMSK